MKTCDNNCEALADLYQSSVDLIAYGKLIDKWLNGAATATVNIGGENVPTLRNLVLAIKELVGVWPDDITVKIDSATKKIYVPLRPNGGVHVGSNGLYIDSADFLQLGGGLAKDSNGNIYVNFDAMPTDKFEKLLKSLRLPIWLTKNTTFYVDKNHAQAADTLVEGRGLSANKPFKTIQACVNYVCENYNLGGYNAYIRIGGGTYDERVVLGSYNSTTGFIRIMPAADNDVVIIRNTGSGRQNAQNCALNVNAGNWSVEYVKIAYAPEAFTQNDYNAYAVYCTGGISLIACHLMVDLSGTDSGGNAMTAYMIGVSGASAGATLTPGTKKTIFEFKPHATTTNSLTVLSVLNGGSLNGDVSRETGYTGLVECRFNTMGLFMHATGNGSVTFRQMTGLTVPNISFQAGSGYTITGKRYDISKGATCNVYGMGDNYFPGTINGTVEADTYSWYK